MPKLRDQTKAAVRRAISFQETEDTGRPRPMSEGERKRVGDEVTRVAKSRGVGGKFTAPEGLDQKGLNKWQEAAIADINQKAKK
jgi:hypothetical protein